MPASLRLSLVFAAPLAGALVFASCGEKETSSIQSELKKALEEKLAEPEPAPPAPKPAGPSQEEVTAALQAQEFGRKLLGKTVYLEDGKFTPADLRSAPEYYIIHWSASWWGPCKKHAPQLVEQYNKLIAPNPKVAFIHASLDFETAEALAWARKENFPWPTVLMDDLEATGLDKLGGQEEVPDTVLIDRAGKVLTRDEEEAFSKIAALN